jgi:hypothetical protein
MLGPGVESGFSPADEAQAPETDIQESGP